MENKLFESIDGKHPHILELLKIVERLYCEDKPIYQNRLGCVELIIYSFSVKGLMHNGMGMSVDDMDKNYKSEHKYLYFIDNLRGNTVLDIDLSTLSIDDSFLMDDSEVIEFLNLFKNS